MQPVLPQTVLSSEQLDLSQVTAKAKDDEDREHFKA
jgi:hypothetical protein